MVALASTEEHRRALAHFWLRPPLVPVTDIHNPDAELPYYYRAHRPLAPSPQSPTTPPIKTA